MASETCHTHWGGGGGAISLKEPSPGLAVHPQRLVIREQGQGCLSSQAFSEITSYHSPGTLHFPGRWVGAGASAQPSGLVLAVRLCRGSSLPLPAPAAVTGSPAHSGPLYQQGGPPWRGVKWEKSGHFLSPRQELTVTGWRAPGMPALSSRKENVLRPTQLPTRTCYQMARQ